jgi:hypothetical protein
MLQQCETHLENATYQVWISCTEIYSPPPWLHGPFSLALASLLKSHTVRRTVGLLWTSDQSVTGACTYTGQHNI